MTSSRHFEGDILFYTGYGSLFSVKMYTTVVFMSFRMSAFTFGVCFSTFICFSFVFNKKFQHVQMLDSYPCCLLLLKLALIIMIVLAQVSLQEVIIPKNCEVKKKKHICVCFFMQLYVFSIFSFDNKIEE